MHRRIVGNKTLLKNQRPPLAITKVYKMTTASSNDPARRETSAKYGKPTRSGKIPYDAKGAERPCETAYWLWGDLEASKVPLIVLHGGPGAPGRDLQVLAMLYHDHGIPVLLYDQIGCGESTLLPERVDDKAFWTEDLFLAEIDNLRQHLKIERFDLLGHSCGGMLATLYTLMQPKGLRKLIIASSMASEDLRLKQRASYRESLSQEKREFMATCEREGHKDSSEYKAAADELARLHFFRPAEWPLELKETFNYLEKDSTVGKTLYGDQELVNTGTRRSYNTIPRLHEITEKTVPGGVLLTNGHHELNDEAMSPFFSSIHARVKWVRFANSAHFPHLEETEAYNKALAEFLNMNRG